MVIDRIEQQKKYYPLNSLFEEAFAFLSETPDLEPGRYSLEDGIYASVTEFDTKPLEDAELEVHKKYIDLHYCIAGGERMSWAAVEELQPTHADVQGDNYYYAGRSTSISVRPGMFYIMFPQDAHRSGCHHEFPKHCRKVVVKIPVNP